MGMPVTVKGQVTIPKPIRDRLGLTPGSRVEFEVDGQGRVVPFQAGVAGGAAPGRPGSLPATHGHGERTGGHVHRRDHEAHRERGRGLTLVDTNVLLDVARGDASWAAWSDARLDERAACGPSRHQRRRVRRGLDQLRRGSRTVNAFLGQTGFRLEPMPRPALFLAGRPIRAYRRRGGTRTGVLPDFFIGAHAGASGTCALLTRDAAPLPDLLPDACASSPR